MAGRDNDLNRQEAIVLWKKCGIESAIYRFETKYDNSGDSSWDFVSEEKGGMPMKKLRKLINHLDAMIPNEKGIKHNPLGKYLLHVGQIAVTLEKDDEKEYLSFLESSYLMTNHYEIYFQIPIKTTQTESDVFEKHLAELGDWGDEQFYVCCKSDCIFDEVEFEILESIHARADATIKEALSTHFKLKQDFEYGNRLQYVVEQFEGKYFLLAKSSYRNRPVEMK